MAGAELETWRDLLDSKKSFAHIATLMKDGTPQVTPVWIDFKDGKVLVNSARGRVKEQLERAKMLAERGERMSAGERSALADSVFRQAGDMSELVAKILQMTRLESGAMKPDRDWMSIAEVAAAVLDRLRERLAGHRVIVEIPEIGRAHV